MGSKRVISCAVTGSIHVPSMSEYLPVTAKQIAEHGVAAAEAGAASIHIHVRDEKDGRPVSDMELFKRVIDGIREKNEEVIICTTTGGGLGMTPEERVMVVTEYAPELASMNAGSLSWGLFELLETGIDFKHDWEQAYYEMTRDFVFTNTFESMMKFLTIFKEKGTKPELECYELGHIHNVKWLMDRGYVEGKPFIQFCTGINGGIGGGPESIIAMKECADRVLGPGKYEFSAFGAGRQEIPSCVQSLLLGGHPRVGLEDNLYLSRGVLAKRNADLVEKIVRIMDEMGLQPATPGEAREMLELPGPRGTN